MNRSNVTYAQLKQLLLSMGLEDRSSAGYMIFQHPDCGALLRLAEHDDDESVTPHDIVKARTTLYWNGLMEHADFDNWVRDAELQRHPSRVG